MITQLLKFILSTQGSKARMKRDLVVIKQTVDGLQQDLVPWVDHELELLSYNTMNTQRSKGINPMIKGMITNIYKEAVIAFAYKDYYNNNRRSVLYARSSDHEFEYKISEQGIEVSLNHLLLGTMHHDGSFYQRNSLIATVGQSKTMSLLPIEVRGKQVAALVNPRMNNSPNSRAVKIIETPTKEEEDLILALSVYEMIEKTIQV